MKEFVNYFSGLKRNYGYCNIDKGFIDPETGKIKFDPKDYGWSKKNITDQDYIDHLDGKKSIGIQPCDDQGLASFGAIDIDPANYTNFKIEKYLNIIKEKNLPVIPIKSKSNGLHIYVFLEKPVEAKIVRAFLENLLFVFGLPSKTEIYPKQTSLGKNADGNPINGNFINLPYFKKVERIAVAYTGDELDFETFIETVKLNLQTEESLKKFTDKIITDELNGGAEEFIDGPPCLQRITKELKEKNIKLTDGRDRFLFNFMVFAKKKYGDSWEKEVDRASEEYMQYDRVWDKGKVQQKIKSWQKETAGHTCGEEPIVNKCFKSECIKRKFGIRSDLKKNWPMLTALERIDYRPDPEFYLNVTLDDNTVVQIHAKDINKISEMKELRKLIASQTKIIPPKIKDNEFQIILDSLWSNIKIMSPPKGTDPISILRKHLYDYIQDVRAKSHTSFASGAVLISKVKDLSGDFAFFIYDNFYEELKSREWKLDQQRTASLIERSFSGAFDKQKRYPKQEKEKKENPPIRCLRIPMSIFSQENSEEKEEHELIEFENTEDIV